MILFSQNRTPYPLKTEHMATHLIAPQLNYLCVSACEDVILTTHILPAHGAMTFNQSH